MILLKQEAPEEEYAQYQNEREDDNLYQAHGRILVGRTSGKADSKRQAEQRLF